MKIYIHTDLEGVSGVDNIAMIQPENARYDESRLRLTEDVNAAIAGAFDGGATGATVLDSHGGGTQHNILWDRIDKRAVREPRPAQRWWGNLDSSYAATFFIGAHAMAGTANAFLDHTQSSQSWYDYYVNGRKVGELGQWGLVAGHFGVPIVMVAGDEAACAEAYAFFSPVETSPVKRGVGRMSAVLVDLDETHRRIRDAARKAMAHVGKARPFMVNLPAEIILDLQRTDWCDEHAREPGVERVGPRRVRKIARTALEILP
jgi:D-amino peptidase